MARMFLDPATPLSTCTEASCRDCALATRLSCHFNGRQLGLFLALVAPLFLAAGWTIYDFRPLLLVPWGAFILAYFGLIEIRVLCSHCPHYAEPTTKTLKCWANYGSPKLWRYRPGPLSTPERSVFYLGLALIFASPLFILLVEGHLALLLGYGALLAAWKLALGAFFCSHCMNFACPFNPVDEPTRRAFFAKNPRAGEAWPPAARS